jgi:hypothetical protein
LGPRQKGGLKPFAVTQAMFFGRRVKEDPTAFVRDSGEYGQDNILDRSQTPLRMEIHWEVGKSRKKEK